ncbi:DJ-1/PfpI family protein [Actinomarinicola tropica]|uniref:DJ-1/PfpI family protein n=1 Tax=Actinomarinicola tropica TaxID=2789776 RepID=A0A5Q2RPV9_9ACTN|nr:DJ-1/PfpI family protein [Actinomarinicola tropica]QGG96157.1 DJ-1/PfpI family protein [Actinomarinicola tropica]
MQIAIALFPEFTSLDAMGPYQVLQHVPGADLRLCAAERGIVADDSGHLRVEVEHTFADVPRPDVLVVPGGTVTRRMMTPEDAVVTWIREAHPHTTWTTSVCTGSLLLGAAGLLDGLTATTHWSAYDALASTGATPTEQRVVVEGKVVTGAGVSAGIDMALTLVAEMCGPEVAMAIQLGIEYDPQPPFDAGSPSTAPPAIRDGLLARSI